MKVLIGILACKRDREYEQLVRDTWLTRCTVDYGFFVGRELAPAQAADEVILDCSDGQSIRDSVPKTKALVQYAWDNGYDFLFKCDIDTYVHVPRLLASGFEQHNWSGYGQPYGGSGYWLSRPAMALLLDKPVSFECEDWWVAKHLAASGVHLTSRPALSFQDASGSAAGQRHHHVALVYGRREHRSLARPDEHDSGIP